jgi:hypothetical protein
LWRGETEDQFTSLMAEITADQPGAKLKADNTLIGDGSTFSGNNWSHLDALNLDVKNWENVHIQHLGTELVQNWDFEQDQINPGAYISQTPVSWTNEAPGITPEVVKAPYGGQTGFGSGESQWLDSAASPRGIDVSQQMELGTGHQARLSVSVSAQDLHLPSGTFTIDPSATLEFQFDGHTVLTLGKDDFAGFTDLNHFRTFTADVVGEAGPDHLEIISHGQGGAFVGFAIDHVSLKEWII